MAEQAVPRVVYPHEFLAEEAAGAVRQPDFIRRIRVGLRFRRQQGRNRFGAVKRD